MIGLIVLIWIFGKQRQRFPSPKTLYFNVNGFIILDLHNIYCQTHNFGIEFEKLLKWYPLDLVREVHLSGGSWATTTLDGQQQKIRRDTHDDAVPMEVFTYLAKALPKLPNLKFVILEQLGNGLATEVSRQQFRADFKRMKAICANFNAQSAWQQTNPFLLSKILSINDLPKPYIDEQLATEQAVLNTILETSKNVVEAKNRLTASMLNNSDWQIEQWNDAMLETAFAIAQKWKNGFVPQNQND